MRLEHGERYHVDLNVIACLSKMVVKEAINEIERIKAGVKPMIHRELLKDLSPFTKEE